MNVALIREKCKERNITIAEFERLANLSNGSVGMWAKSRNAPRADTLKKAADFLGVTMEELLLDDATE